MSEFLRSLIEVGNNFLWSKLLVIALVILGLIFTFRSRFVQLRYIKEMIRVLFEKSEKGEDGKKKISSFGAFTIGAASRIGTGNIAGVAIAITVGGPGAIFWMWVVSIFGAVLAFIESTLAQVYKVKDKDGYKGGPAYYMEQGLKSRWMGILFSILIICCFGLVFTTVQSNTIAVSFESNFQIPKVVTGALLILLTAMIIYGGSKRISQFTEIVVPFLSVFYLGLASYVMITNFTDIPEMFSLIFSSAFGLNEVVGGTIGAAILNGVKRGLFATEAGLGSAPNAAASASTSHPVKQGLMQTFGVLTDSFLICTSSAFIILLSDVWQKSDLTGIELTTAALQQNVGSWAGIFMSVTIFLFAFSSIIGNYYYGQTNLDFIKENKILSHIFKLLLLAMIMLGALASIKIVWDLADLLMALMAVTNLIAITLLSKVAFKTLKNYDQQKKEGKDPVFVAEDIDLMNNEIWTKK